MKLKPSDFDWEKYDYHVEWVEEVFVHDSLNSHLEANPLESLEVAAVNLVRIPKPEPVYQLLTPGTWIREGDEMSLGDDCWKKVVGTCGFSAARNEIWRRKLPEGTKLP